LDIYISKAIVKDLPTVVEIRHAFASFQQTPEIFLLLQR